MTFSSSADLAGARRDSIALRDFINVPFPFRPSVQLVHSLAMIQLIHVIATFRETGHWRRARAHNPHSLNERERVHRFLFHYARYFARLRHARRPAAGLLHEDASAGSRNRSEREREREREVLLFPVVQISGYFLVSASKAEREPEKCS